MNVYGVFLYLGQGKWGKLNRCAAKWSLKNPLTYFLIFSGDSWSCSFKRDSRWNIYSNIHTLWADSGLRSAGQDPGVNMKGFSVKPGLYRPWLFPLASIWDRIPPVYRAVRSGYGHIPLSFAFVDLQTLGNFSEFRKKI